MMKWRRRRRRRQRWNRRMSPWKKARTSNGSWMEMAGRRWMGGEGWSWKLVDRVLYKAKHKGHWGLFL